jgi:hypothetical protein
MSINSLNEEESPERGRSKTHKEYEDEQGILNFKIIIYINMTSIKTQVFFNLF